MPPEKSIAINSARFTFANWLTAPENPFFAKSVANRVWFHQNEDGSGWSKCYSGGGHVYSIASAFQHPGNIFVSDNTAPC